MPLRYHGPQAAGQNLARFKLAEVDRLFEHMSTIEGEPQREAMFLKAKRLAVAYMPYKLHVHRLASDLVHPWLIGFCSVPREDRCAYSAALAMSLC